MAGAESVTNEQWKGIELAKVHKNMEGQEVAGPSVATE